MEISRTKAVGIGVTILVLVFLATLAIIAERQRPPAVIDEEKERLIEGISQVENTLAEDEKEKLIEEIQAVKNELSEEEKKRLMEELNNY